MSLRKSLALWLGTALLVIAGAVAFLLPDAPGNVRPLILSCTKVILTWDPVLKSELPVFAYRIRRNGIFYNWTIHPTTTLIDGNVIGPKTYTYDVSALDITGRLSVASSSVKAEIPSCVAVKAGNTWLQAYGSSYSDLGQDVALHENGNIALTGRFKDRLNLGGGNLISHGTTDAFVGLFTPEGRHRWSTSIGGIGAATVPESVAIDRRGDVVVAGWHTATIATELGDLVSAGDIDLFILKFAGGHGGLLWQRQIGSLRADLAYGVTTTATGDVFVTGMFQRTVDFGGTVLKSSSGGFDAFVVKLKGDTGETIWVKSWPNFGADGGMDIAVDSKGNPIMTGYFGSMIDFGNLGRLNGSPVANNAFVAKLDGSDGRHLWSNTFLASGSSRSYGVAIDPQDNVAIAGFYEKAALFSNTGKYASGGSDSFVVAYTPDGIRRWVQIFPNNGADAAADVTMTSGGNVVVTGQFRGAMLTGSSEVESHGYSDVYLVEMKGTTGDITWASRLGGAGNDQAYGIAADGDGHVVATGFFTDTAMTNDLPAITSAGSSDIFLLSLAP
jgi:hypothetical protein